MDLPVIRIIDRFLPIGTKFVGGIRYSNFDCHYVVPHATEAGASDVAFYVSKYVLKVSANEVRLQQALRLNLSPRKNMPKFGA